MSDTNVERRKVICRTLTDVLQRSGLGDELDPQAFYMMVSTNFAVLNRPDGLDLEPLWGSLIASVGREDPRLPGLFVAFAESARELGLAAHQPLAVSGLDAEQQRAALAQAFARTSDEAVVERIPAHLHDPDATPPALESHDLHPVLTEEHKRELTRLIVAGFKSTALGPQIDGSQLGYRLDEHFDLLCDGRAFTIEPVLDGLRQMEGYADRDMYVALVRLQRKFYDLGVELVVPALEVGAEEGLRLLADAEAQERAERRRMLAPAATPRPNLTPAPILEAPPSPVPPALQTRESRRTALLRRYGLLGIGSEQWRRVRVALALMVLVGTSATAWMFRPSRPTDPAGLAVPLREARLEAGSFVGLLDAAAWYKLPPPARRERVQRFEAELRSRGWSADARIIDGQGRILIKGNGGGQLKGSRFVLESPDGVRPPPPGQPIDPKTASAQGDPVP